MTPTVVSLFAGLGGSSLGYKLAGFDVRLAVEWDDNAVESGQVFGQTHLNRFRPQLRQHLLVFDKCAL